jgi:hypothetical protein
VKDSLSSFVVNDNCILGMGVGQQITNIVGADSFAWALATSIVPLSSSAVEGTFLQAMIAACSRLQIPLSEERLTATASNAVEKCIVVSKCVAFRFKFLFVCHAHILF